MISNPDMTRIINATKISGRNAKGLGVGFFNAMTTNTYGELKTTEDKATREIMTQPFTNYNVAVIDKNLKNRLVYHFYQYKLLDTFNQVFSQCERRGIETSPIRQTPSVSWAGSM